MKKETEQFFTAIQKDHQRLDEKVDKGFRDIREEMNFRFKAVGDRFDAVDRRFNKMDERFDHIDDTLEMISVMAKTNEKERHNYDHRLKKIEANI